MELLVTEALKVQSSAYEKFFRFGEKLMEQNRKYRTMEKEKDDMEKEKDDMEKEKDDALLLVASMQGKV